MRYLKTTLTSLALIAITGCSSSGAVKNEDGHTVYADIKQTRSEQVGSESSVELSSLGSSTKSFNETSLVKDKLDLPEHRIVYFGYDDSSLSQASMDTLKVFADYLLKSNTKVTLNGHTDARGTQEYNIALGERRGNAVKTYLLNEGVDESSITVVSYGEELPAVMGGTEYAYAQNRRVEINL